MALSEAARAKRNALKREEYNWYKNAGICPQCAKAYAEPGRVYCGPCYRHMRAVWERNDPGAVKRKSYNNARRARLKAAGICVDCGNAKAKGGKTRCGACERKMKESRQKYEIKKRLKRNEG